MTDSEQNGIPLTWYGENFATFSAIGTGIFVLWLLFFTYNRSGSLLFLRDVLWRFFGGTPKFENPRFEQMRKDLRELEYFRYEFNIPANTLQDAELAEEWIYDHGFTPRDFGRIKNYIDWNDFNDLKFRTRKISTGFINLFFGLALALLLSIAPVPIVLETKYLMASLKNSPGTPSFYLADDHIKLELWPEDYLTVNDCRASESLSKFIMPNLNEKKLDILCSFFLDPNYRAHVHKGLKQQRILALSYAILAFSGMLWLAVHISRIEVARRLHKQWQMKS